MSDSDSFPSEAQTSDKMNSTTLIEGSLTAAIDDESSDEESDDDECAASPENKFDFDNRLRIDSDDDEELEVFVGSEVKSSTRSVSAPKTDGKASKSLVDAMMESVNEVEMFGSSVVAPTNMTKNSKGSTPSKTPLVSILETSAPEPDVFGIAYKPFLKKKEEYSMPKGVAFEDEAEFEKELSVPVKVKVDTEDDEFDFDDSCPQNEFPTSSEKNFAAQRALENAARKQREADEEVRFMAALKDENRQQLQREEELLKENTPKVLEEVENKPSIRVAAKQSLDEIVGIYSSGLGDQEVRMLNIDVSKTSVSNDHKIQIQKGATATIDEGDEEEAEREELEKDQREESALADETLHKTQLEAEWESVAANANNDSLSWRQSSSAADVEYVDITYDAALEYLSNEDYKQYESSICVRDEPAANWSLLNRPAQLKFDGCEEKLKFPFLLAQLNYEPSKPQLLNVMRKIFHTLTSLDSSESEEGTSKGITAEFSSSQCPTVGPHWERIGFQGLDPRTDVNRSMKMLAILQTLNMVESSSNLVRMSFYLSNLTPSPATGGSDLSWPFMCVSIMFTKEAVQAMRSGELNKECNRRMDILSVINEFHQACFFDFVRRIIDEPTVHHAVHLAKVRDLCKKSPLEVLKANKTAVSTDYSTLSLEILFSNVQKGTKKTVDQKGKSRGISAVQAPKPQEIEMETGDLSFDDLEVIEKVLEAKTLAEKSDVSEEEKKSISKSIWSTLTGGSKASKFRA